MKIPPKGYIDSIFEIKPQSHGFDLIGKVRTLEHPTEDFGEGNLKWMALIFLFQDLVIDYNGDREAMLHYLAEFEDTPVLRPPSQCDCDECQRMRQEEDDDA